MEIVLGVAAAAALGVALVFRADAEAWRDLYRVTDEARDRWVDRYMALTAEVRKLRGVLRECDDAMREAWSVGARMSDPLVHDLMRALAKVDSRRLAAALGA